MNGKSASVNGTRPDLERLFLRGIGKRVRLARLTREWSQEQLAVASGMSRNFVSSIERGAHGADVVRLANVALALGVELAELLPSLRETGSGMTGATNLGEVRRW